MKRSLQVTLLAPLAVAACDEAPKQLAGPHKEPTEQRSTSHSSVFFYPMTYHVYSPGLSPTVSYSPGLYHPAPSTRSGFGSTARSLSIGAAS